jgi:hypothetical protein
MYYNITYTVHFAKRMPHKNNIKNILKTIYFAYFHSTIKLNNF